MAKRRREAGYPTDLTDAQWAVLAPLLARQGGPGRPRTVSLRAVVNALLYMARAGCPWRFLPREFPHWTAVRYYFDKWTQDGTWAAVNRRLCRLYHHDAERLLRGYSSDVATNVEHLQMERASYAAVLAALMAAVAMAPYTSVHAAPASQAVLLQDDFTDPTSGWGRGDGAVGRYDYAGGEYLVIRNAGAGTTLGPLHPTRLRDFRAEIDARLEPPARDAYLFLDFRVQPNDGNYYSFAVFPSSRSVMLALVRRPSQVIPLIDETYVPRMNAGPEWNRIGILASGASITLLVNGEAVARANDATIQDGQLSFGVGNSTDNRSEGRFRNLVVTSTPTAPPSAAPATSGQRPLDLEADGTARLLALRALLRQMNSCLPKPLRGIRVFYEPPTQYAWRPEVRVGARGVDFSLMMIRASEQVTTAFGTRMMGTPSADVPSPVLLIQPLTPEEFPGTRLPEEFIQSWDADVAAAVACFNQSAFAADPSATSLNGLTSEEMLARMASCLPALPPPVPPSREERAAGMFILDSDARAFGVDRARPGIVNAPHTQHPDDLELQLVFLRYGGNGRPAMGWDAYAPYQAAVFACFLGTSAR